MTQLSNTPAKDLKEKYDLKLFVETGCEEGYGIEYAHNIGFELKNIFSCDIRAEAIFNTNRRIPGAYLRNIDSLIFLQDLLPNINNRTMFWLDAHYPEHYGVQSTTNTKMPLLEEIALIKKLKPTYVKDVIICDDTRVFVDEKNSRYIPGEIPEYYYIYNAWDKLTSILADTHTFTQYNHVEGIGVFTPN